MKMLTFLGMTVGSLQGKVPWIPKGYLAIKQALALTLPDYEKPFLLLVSYQENNACGMLAKMTGVGSYLQPTAYYSVSITPVEIVLPGFYHHLAAVHLMYEKTSALTVGCPVEILSHHKLVKFKAKLIGFVLCCCIPVLGSVMLRVVVKQTLQVVMMKQGVLQNKSSDEIDLHPNLFSTTEEEDG